MIAVNAKTGIEIPERDYPKLSSLNKAIVYLEGSRCRLTPRWIVKPNGSTSAVRREV